MSLDMLEVMGTAKEWRWGYDIKSDDDRRSYVVERTFTEIVSMALLSDWAKGGHRIEIYRRNRWEREWHLFLVTPAEPSSVYKQPKERRW